MYSVSYKVVLQLVYFSVTIFILINNITLYFKSWYIIATIIYRLWSHITYWKLVNCYILDNAGSYVYIIMTTAKYLQVFISDYLVLVISDFLGTFMWLMVLSADYVYFHLDL
jgi:hypothetical protein